MPSRSRTVPDSSPRERICTTDTTELRVEPGSSTGLTELQPKPLPLTTRRESAVMLRPGFAFFSESSLNMHIAHWHTAACLQPTVTSASSIKPAHTTQLTTRHLGKTPLKKRMHCWTRPLAQAGIATDHKKVAGRLRHLSGIQSSRGDGPAERNTDYRCFRAQTLVPEKLS